MADIVTEVWEQMTLVVNSVWSKIWMAAKKAMPNAGHPSAIRGRVQGQQQRCRQRVRAVYRFYDEHTAGSRLSLDAPRFQFAQNAPDTDFLAISPSPTPRKRT
jgi:hypothetical protein